MGVMGPQREETSAENVTHASKALALADLKIDAGYSGAPLSRMGVVSACLSARVCMCWLYMYTRVRRYVCTRAHTQRDESMCAHVHTHTHTHTHSCLNTHTHTYTPNPPNTKYRHTHTHTHSLSLCQHTDTGCQRETAHYGAAPTCPTWTICLACLCCLRPRRS